MKLSFSISYIEKRLIWTLKVKCQWIQSEIDFIGFTLSKYDIKPIKAKVNIQIRRTNKALREWMMPNLSETLAKL